MGFLWDPILGKLNGEANLERGRSRSLPKVSSCRQEKRGVESWSECFDQAVEKRLLRNILGFGELEMEEKTHPFLIANWKMMVRAEFQKLAKLVNKPTCGFKLFSIFLMVFLGNSIGWFNHHLEMISISRSIHQEFQFCWAYTRSIFSYIFPKYKLTANKSCFPNHCRMCPGVRVVLWSEGISNLLYIYPKNTTPPENKFPLISL